MQNLYENARRFVYRCARPLDYARWKYHFEGGSAEEVVHLLAAYQNPDGGFGHALEQDSLCPLSTPIQTWCATTILREISLFDPDHAMVAGILRYLGSGHAFNGHTWAYTIPEGNDYPHAPWWHHPENFDPGEIYYNPAASLAGYMLRSAAPGSQARKLAEKIAVEAYQFYMSTPPKLEMHLLPCYLALCRDVQAVMPTLFDTSAMFDRLKKDIADCLMLDADRWDDNYCAMPSDILTGKDDPLYAIVSELADRECAFIARTQQWDGAWPINWRWSDYPDAFAVSANFWRGSICMKNILFLKGMGKL